jgi:methylated-DNA-[protein]-cysteine S-methyltransferase
MTVTHTVLDSPLGELTLVADGGSLAGLYFAGQRNRPRPAKLGARSPAALTEAVRQLGEYFAAERTAFDLDLAPAAEPFDRRVRAALLAIPYGQTRSYRDLAAQLGDPGLAQAVGAAAARNRIGIVVPCHRLVGADGSLTGYAGGLPRKRALLELERPAAVLAGRLF